jgi:3',5'-cyclic AMP phosphodiesterase CpdA
MEDERIAGRLLEDLNGVDPSLVVISGDLTQRARKRQFEAAGAFIRKITAPCLVVPGNHDIPFYDVMRRALTPLHRYRHCITADLNPVFEDDELIVLGANTARAGTFKNGRISAAQIKMLAGRLCSAGSHLFKVLVTHHPFLPPLDIPYAASVGRAGLAAGALEPCGLDLLLAGHYHRGYMGDLQSRDITVKRSIIVAQAGTAISKRTRGERNSYDRIKVDPPEICFDRYAWDGCGFVKTKTTRFKKVGGAWLLQPQDTGGTRS